MMAGAGGAMRATGWRATAIRFQQFGEGLYGPLRSTFPTGTLSLGAGRGGFTDDFGCQRLRFYKETAIGIGVSSAAKPRSAKRLSKRFVCCCFERRLK